MYRLDMSHVTTRRTMEQCCRSLHVVTTSRPESPLTLSVVKSGKSKGITLFILNLLYRCLAHIINLATQVVISTCSKSKYYSGDPEDDTVPEDAGTGDQDKIGIIGAICMKVWLIYLLPLFTYGWDRHAPLRNESNCSRQFKSVSIYVLASCCWT